MHIKAQLIKLIFPYILSYSYVHHSGKRLTLAKPGQIFVKNEALQIFLKHTQSTPSTNTPKVESTHWKYHHEMEECNFTSINNDCFIFDPVRQNIQVPVHTQNAQPERYHCRMYTSKEFRDGRTNYFLDFLHHKHSMSKFFSMTTHQYSTSIFIYDFHYIC